MPPGEHSRSRSSAELDPRMFQLLLEFNERLDEKLKERREEIKEDFRVALIQVFHRLDRLDERLADGAKRFESQEARMDDHSEKITNAMKLVDEYRARQRSSEQQKGTPKNVEGGWISVDRIPAILTALGILLSSVLSTIALLRSPGVTPQVASTGTSTTMTPSTPTGTTP